MKEIKVFGGLGNQLFQFAFFLYLQKENPDIVMNISDFAIHSHHHGFELERVFGIEGPFSDQTNRKLTVPDNLVVRLTKKMFKVRISKATEYYENKEVSFIPPEKLTADIFFVGFWQDIRYIESVEKELREILAFQSSILHEGQKLVQTLTGRDTVSVHVRRGDYMTNTDFCGSCNKDYYERAIAHFQDEFESPHFVFFSDDIDYCRKEFSTCDATFVDWNRGENSYRDMQLMSMCRHHIIANSTFSWWGAWLNPSMEKVVVMPRRWSTHLSGKRLCASNWIML